MGYWLDIVSAPIVHGSDIVMPGSLLQADRRAEFTSPLGKDVLVLTDFSGSEGLGELFEYHIEALSDQENVDFDPAIGQGCMVKLKTDDGKTRIYHGIMTEAQWIGYQNEFYRYRVVLRPWLWLLGHKADCRIFLDKNVKDIIQDVFSKAGFTDFEFRTTASYDKIEYCVQYRESDLAFVCRLMEHWGIYYFFEPSDGKHTLVLADSRSSHKPVSDLPKVAVNLGAGAYQDEEQTLSDWVSQRRFRTGKVHFNDYDYLQPKKDLKAPKEAAEKYTHAKLEVYDYHHKYDEKGKGENHSQFRLEAEQAIDHRRTGNGDAASLHPGGLVTVEKHPTSKENAEYLIVHASHHFTSQHYRSGGGAGPQGYNGAFVFQPSDRPFRSLPLTPKPRIYGIHTAKVVGKKGEESEEISTDEHGRIWVQFHWDREPQKSCPIRVAQVWAGKKWGGMFIPRVGMEVVVDFLEGDPDKPLVTGCVYNGDNKPPYDLPDNKTMAGMKSESSKGGNGYNEFVFDDKANSELIRMHAEKDHKVTILNSQTREIGEKFMSPQGSPSRETTLKMGDDKLTLNMGHQNVNLQMGNQKIDLDLGMQTTNTLQGITLNVCFGLSSISITPASITLLSPTINLTAMAAVNIQAPAFTVTSAATAFLGGPVGIAPGPLAAIGLVVPPV
jgi:type VI secretion system secreted protein VgrG